MMRAATARLRPPDPPTTTRMPTSAQAGAAERQDRRVDAGQRLHEAEAGLLVVAQHVAGNGAAIAQADPDGFGLRDEIADGEHDAVFADQGAMPDALGAQDLGRERIGRNERADAHHRA